MRVVFDTNIFISAFVVPGSQAEKAVINIIESQDTLVISKDITGEVLSVLSSKFSRDREAISRTAVNLSELAEVVYPRKKIHVLQDEPDNRILECAVSGKADVIVTGDREMLKLKKYQGVKIISLKEYLET
ncbi:MAG TPA: putative toxin-antitoxin system toxin component, PIN family [Nitrospirae bacterium]|nr:PIN domain protein [bacterium BMS3Abin10]GBE37603.1 PIN domain protein [bacterium BMS3Bbin08]HDH51646.1 putative toxin-antitoxin system toxin component, PIN family [Nitrospirota bacterium]HDK82368.1 putative toxin-antitoxin system toxin component, PIN family [Nitrospirota bacterium]HDO26333.1 putative toxin-antitoxin system toxin component, PIN family [Nitrospirota bacterium]